MSFPLPLDCLCKHHDIEKNFNGLGFGNWVDYYGDWEFETDQDHLMADGLISKKRKLLFVVMESEVLTYSFVYNTR